MVKEMNRTKATAKQEEDYQKPDALSAVEEIVSNAKKRQKASKPSLTDSERLRGIRQNRATEKEVERNRSGIKSKNQSVPFRSNKTQSNDSLDYPDMDAFLEDDDD